MFNSKFRTVLFRLAPWLLGSYWALLFVATHVPVPAGPPASDKVIHFCAYLGLAFLFAMFLRTRQVAWKRVVFMTICVLFAWAVFDELTQKLVDRYCDPLDALADWFGVVGGLVVFYLAERFLGSITLAQPGDGNDAG